ncbi:MAG: hypothetical protein HRU12_02740 [Phaeodactylibacter sp.]|nr:hypothetical protein [Phaeodactylibacter sp.]
MNIADEIIMRDMVMHLVRTFEQESWQKYLAEVALLHTKRKEFAVALQAMHEMHLDLWKQLHAANATIRSQQTEIAIYKQEVKEIIQEFKNERKFEKYISRVDPGTGDVIR